MKLDNPCMYSFEDLVSSTYETILARGGYLSKKQLNKLLLNVTQFKRNDSVKMMCNISGWYWCDVVGSDMITYTTFSPNLKK